MSRSYKKIPGYKDSNTFFKRYANRRARKFWNWDIQNGCSYKKLMDAYNICDWKNLFFSEQEINKLLINWGDPIYTKYKFFMK